MLSTSVSATCRNFWQALANLVNSNRPDSNDDVPYTCTSNSSLVRNKDLQRFRCENLKVANFEMIAALISSISNPYWNFSVPRSKKMFLVLPSSNCFSSCMPFFFFHFQIYFSGFAFFLFVTCSFSVNFLSKKHLCLRFCVKTVTRVQLHFWFLWHVYFSEVQSMHEGFESSNLP